jgi:hypothetical protein
MLSGSAAGEAKPFAAEFAKATRRKARLGDFLGEFFRTSSVKSFAHFGTLKRL